MEGRHTTSEGPRTRLTYGDFLLFPDDGLRHEIIDGEHYVTPSPNLRHQQILGRLYFEIEAHLRRHPGTGRVFMAPLDVLFTRWDVVEPDLLFVAHDQAEILTPKNIQGPPALVVEILSRGTRKTDKGAPPLRARRRARVLAGRPGARYRDDLQAPTGWQVSRRGDARKGPRRCADHTAAARG